MAPAIRSQDFFFLLSKFGQFGKLGHFKAKIFFFNLEILIQIWLYLQICGIFTALVYTDKRI